MIYTLMIITVCVCLDKWLTPIWNIINYTGRRLQEKFEIAF